MPGYVAGASLVFVKVFDDLATPLLLFAVDEGILQVARYTTPDPLGFLFQKRSLDVGTVQILDLILPEFRAALMQAAPGGDARERQQVAALLLARGPAHVRQWADHHRGSRAAAPRRGLKYRGEGGARAPRGRSRGPPGPGYSRLYFPAPHPSPSRAAA